MAHKVDLVTGIGLFSYSVATNTSGGNLWMPVWFCFKFFRMVQRLLFIHVVLLFTLVFVHMETIDLMFHHAVLYI